MPLKGESPGYGAAAKEHEAQHTWIEDGGARDKYHSGNERQPPKCCAHAKSGGDAGGINDGRRPGERRWQRV